MAGVLASPSWGCMEVQSLIKVGGDGSGTLVQTVTMSPEAHAVMGSAGDRVSEEPTPAPEEASTLLSSGPFSAEKLRARAGTLGEGVTFVSAEAIDLSDKKGVRATYAFRDISRLRLSQKPGPPQDSPGGAVSESRLAFRLSRMPDGRSVLVVNMGQRGGPSKAPGAKRPTADTSPERLEMMKGMLKGMRMSIAVQVEGAVLKTNSPYVSGSTITLLDVDFDALLAEPEKLEQFQALAGAARPSMEDITRLLKGLTGIKVHTEPEVRVEFAPK